MLSFRLILAASLASAASAASSCQTSDAGTYTIGGESVVVNREPCKARSTLPTAAQFGNAIQYVGDGDCFFAFGGTDKKCFIDHSDISGFQIFDCACNSDDCGCGAGTTTTTTTPAPFTGPCADVKNEYRDAGLGDDNTQVQFCGLGDSCPTVISHQKLTDAEQTAILARHNALRAETANGGVAAFNGSLQPATNMMELAWNSSLAAGAQLWAEQCQGLAHDDNRATPTFRSAGQNIFSTSSTSPIPSLPVVDAVNKWYSEVSDFLNTNVSPFAVEGNNVYTREESIRIFGNDSQTGKRKPTGHWSQVVWAGTTHVGCGQIYLDNGPSATFRYNRIIVCNYGPAANVNAGRGTHHVYLEGTVASACPAQHQDNNGDGLCDAKKQNATTTP